MIHRHALEPGCRHKDNKMLLDRLINDKPRFHRSADGSPVSYAVSADVLRYMHGLLTPDMTTLETGAGQTTVLFAIVGTRHTCVTPAGEQVDEIRQYCAELGVGSNVRYIIQSSDIALALDESAPRKLDFVFIDGAHRFPLPAMDWHYTQRKLRVGGIVGIDDIDIPTVRLLHDFLCVEDEWELLNTIGHTAFFKKISEQIRRGDWMSQKINLTNGS